MYAAISAGLALVLSLMALNSTIEQTDASNPDYSAVVKQITAVSYQNCFNGSVLVKSNKCAHDLRKGMQAQVTLCLVLNFNERKAASSSKKGNHLLSLLLVGISRYPQP